MKNRLYTLSFTGEEKQRKEGKSEDIMIEGRKQRESRGVGGGDRKRKREIKARERLREGLFCSCVSL